MNPEKNMKELRKLLDDKKIPKVMQKKILEAMKKTYDANLRTRISRERSVDKSEQNQKKGGDF